MKILVKFPTRGRRKIFEACLKKWTGMASPFHEIFWLFTLDTDDAAMEDWKVPEGLPGAAYYGEPKGKIDAVNRDMEFAPEFDLLVLASDDMVPQLENWDDLIVQLLAAQCKEVLHVNDGVQGENLNTLCILTRQVYRRLGHIYHPDYKSLWADNEFTEVTRAWDVAVYTPRVIIKHAWQSLTGYDALHQVNSTKEVFLRDKLVFEYRQSKGFPKESVLQELGL